MSEGHIKFECEPHFKWVGRCLVIDLALRWNLALPRLPGVLLDLKNVCALTLPLVACLPPRDVVVLSQSSKEIVALGSLTCVAKQLSGSCVNTEPLV